VLQIANDFLTHGLASILYNNLSIRLGYPSSAARNLSSVFAIHPSHITHYRLPIASSARLAYSVDKRTARALRQMIDGEKND
jgi:hypothetical protein